MTIKALGILFIGLCALTVFGYWRYQAVGQSHSVAQFVFIQDPSDSIQNDCGRITGLAERSLAMPETGEGSTITLFSLGNESTANEPQLLGTFQIPVIRRVIEGQRAAAREKQLLLANLRNRCEEVKQTTVSPIFQSLKRGVEHLRTVGSSDDSRYLFIQTDGEEFANRQIMNALDGAALSKTQLPAPIRNEGIRITFCGMAETIGEVTDADNQAHKKSKKRDPQRADRLREVWLKLFTNPELVSFEPYCSRGATNSSD